MRKSTIILLSFFSTLTFAGPGKGKHELTELLKKNNQLEIESELCGEVEDKLGQLFYVTVYNNVKEERYAIAPNYKRFVTDYNIGGVLPHIIYGNGPLTIHERREGFRQLSEAMQHPPFIGIDFHMLPPLEVKAYLPGQKPYDFDNIFGLGIGGGLISELMSEKSLCPSNIAYIHAFLHKASGLNQALGPTIDNSSGLVDFEKISYGVLEKYYQQEEHQIAVSIQESFKEMEVLTTLKHFPFTPENYNLHKETRDEKFNHDQVLSLIEGFEKLKDQSSFIMTTHAFSSEIDSKNIVTFSPEWIRILREDVGFNGLIMTDALFMITHYSPLIQKNAQKWDDLENLNPNPPSIFAIKSILAGHDMVFLEGDWASSQEVFKTVHSLACKKTNNGNNIRQRILESYGRITGFKSANMESLRQFEVFSDNLVQEAIDLITNEKNACDLQRFSDFKNKVRSELE